MPRIRRKKRTVSMNIRVTPEIKDAIDNASAREWLSVSDWIRSTVVKALRARDLLPATYFLPEIDETGSGNDRL
ncbi:MAG: hypothetical protein ABIJ47_14660 [Candidatus Bathyarchaeota archaeon]